MFTYTQAVAEVPKGMELFSTFGNRGEDDYRETYRWRVGGAWSDRKYEVSRLDARRETGWAVMDTTGC